MIASAGQTWSEARAMRPLERRAFIYCRAMQAGARVDWATGRVTWPKPRGNQ